MCCTFDALQRPAEAQAPAPCSMPQGQEAPGSTRAHTAAPAHLRRCLPAWLLVGRAPPCAAAWQGPPRLRLLPSLLLPWWWSPRRRRPPRAAETPRARGRLLCRRRGRLAARRAHHLQAATGRAARSPPGPSIHLSVHAAWPHTHRRWLRASRQLASAARALAARHQARLAAASSASHQTPHCHRRPACHRPCTAPA
jgi:hypothetical protein